MHSIHKRQVRSKSIEYKICFALLALFNNNWRVFVKFISIYNLLIFQVDCANGQTGFGRKRRSPNVSEKSSNKNKIYEVSMSTVVRVGENQVDKNVEIRRKNVESRPQNVEKEPFVVEEGKIEKATRI